jgi:ankyrin repeat protein
MQKGVPKKFNKKLLYSKFKNFMLLLNSKLEMMPVYLDEIIKYYKVPEHSYGFPATHELLFSIRTKNLKMVNKLLDKYKYLVLDYDYFNMTPLHWAVKYNFYQIIPKLVGYGSNVNAQNYIGETPLLIGVKRKFMESVVFLLIYIASPFMKDNKGLGIFDYSKSEFRMKSIFTYIIFYFRN